MTNGLPPLSPNAHQVWTFQRASVGAATLKVAHTWLSGTFILVAFLSQEGMVRSFLWPGCLSGENAAWGFPAAVWMIREGANHRDFKGLGGPREEMKTSPLPLALCICQPGNLRASSLLSPGVFKSVQFQRTLGTLTLSPKQKAGALIWNR